MLNYLRRAKRPILFASAIAFVYAVVVIARAPQADTRIIQSESKKKGSNNEA